MERASETSIFIQKYLAYSIKNKNIYLQCLFLKNDLAGGSRPTYFSCLNNVVSVLDP